MFSTMQNRFIKRKSTFKFVVIYALMTVAVFVIVGLVTFLMLGFRFDVDNGNIEQNAFLQFASVPSGASVSINGDVTGSKTPAKTSVPAGKYNIAMWRDGYETWHKSVDIKSGTLTWLN